MLEIAQHIQAFLHKHDRPPISLHEEMVWERKGKEERREKGKEERREKEKEEKRGEREEKREERKKEMVQSTC